MENSTDLANRGDMVELGLEGVGVYHELHHISSPGVGRVGHSLVGLVIEDLPLGRLVLARHHQLTLATDVLLGQLAKRVSIAGDLHHTIFYDRHRRPALRLEPPAHHLVTEILDHPSRFAAHNHGGAGGHAGTRVGYVGGVRRCEHDIADGEPAGLAGEHGEEHFAPLAHLHRRGENLDPAIFQQARLDLRFERSLAVTGKTRTVEIEAQAQTSRGLSIRSLAAILLELMPPLAKARLPGGGLQTEPGGRAVVQNLPRGQRVPFLQDVAQAHLQWVEAQPTGDLVHLPFGGELDLWRAEAPEGPVGGRMGLEHTASHPHVGTSVRSAGVEHRPRQNHGRQGRIGAAIQDDVDVHGGEMTLGIHSGAMSNP